MVYYVYGCWGWITSIFTAAIAEQLIPAGGVVKSACVFAELRKESVRKFLIKGPAMALLVLAGLALQPAGLVRAQETPRSGEVRPSGDIPTTADLNRRIGQLRAAIPPASLAATAAEYRIGAEDVLEVNVFGAPELNQKLRVSATGDISMPLAGAVEASGLTARELEKALEEKLRTYLNDPHVGVFVDSVESHPISVIGEVKKPGVFQVRGPKTVLEMLSMAEGLADEAGDTVLVMRGAGFAEASSDAHADSAGDPEKASSAGPPSPDGIDGSATATVKTINIDLKLLLDSGDPRYNVPVYPGDIVKVTKAGIVYVVGGVKRPGGFVMRSNEEMSLLKAIALAEGVNETAAKGRTRIIHTDELTGHRSETPVNLGKILAGKAPDIPLKAADVVFVPRSNTKTALLKGAETSVATASGFIIFHP
jgi:polysaccharide biosynthesis/export protein